ncbi:hypothetical protein [Cetobacterium somerae]
MIKINISDDTIKILEKEHKEWYMKKIYPKIEKAIEILEDSLKNFSSDEYPIIRAYIKLLEHIKNKEDDFIIEKDYSLGLKKEDLTSYIEKMKRPSPKENSLLENELLMLEKELIKLSKKKEEKRDYKSKYSPQKLFSYEKLDAGLGDKWGRHKILFLMGINVCPYCQRNYISSYEDKVENEEINKTTADLDHFIPKSVVPFLALSLYNFIPSCQICNSRMKLDEPTIDLSNFENIVINPLIESFDDYGVKFKLENKSTAKLLDTKKKSLEEFKVIIENKSDDQKIQNTIDMFKLDKIYENNHSDYIIDMFESIRNRPDSYLSSIVEIFMDKKYFDDEKLKKEMLDNLKEIVLEPYKFKVKNGEPLGKLTKDILEEFGIDI